MVGEGVTGEEEVVGERTRGEGEIEWCGREEERCNVGLVGETGARGEVGVSCMTGVIGGTGDDVAVGEDDEVGGLGPDSLL
jgi:hypothetical protein